MTFFTQCKDVLRKLALLALLLPLTVLGQIVTQLAPANTVTAVGGGDSYTPLTSPDGRFVLFASTANNLTPVVGSQAGIDRVPASMNVFLQDRQLGVTTLVSVNLSQNGGGNGDSFPSALSQDGRYVLFESVASDLVPGDTNGAKDVFLRDMTAGLTSLVSVGTNGACGSSESREATMTPDGRYVAFVSAATNLVANDTNRIPDVFVRDMQANVTRLASVGASPAANLRLPTPNTPGSSSEWPLISADGRYVAFYSTAIYLLPNPTNSFLPGLTNTGEIFIRDLVNGATTWVSSNAHSVFAAPISANYAMTSDGQYLAYYANQAAVSVIGGPPATGGVFRYNLVSGATDMVATNGYVLTSLDRGERPLDISASGEFVTFLQTNYYLNPIPLASGVSVEIWDAQTGVATLVNAGQTNAHCNFPRIDATGRFVAFLSDEASLTTNGDSALHAYVRDTIGGSAQLVDVNAAGTAPFTSSTTPVSFAGNGSLLAWSAPDGTFAARSRKFDVFARDLLANSTAVISSAAPSLGSVTGSGSSSLRANGVSADGQLVAFSSGADGLSPNDTNGCRDIYVHNFVNGSNTLVSVSIDGTNAGSATSFQPAINTSGRYVIFSSAATNLVANDTNGFVDVFVRDLQSNVTSLVSVNAIGQGEGNGHSSYPSLSADGRFALFLSTATDLVTNSVTSKTTNVFWRDLQAAVTVAISTSGGATAAVMSADGNDVLSIIGAKAFLWRASSQTNATVLTAPTTLQDVAISPDEQRAVCGAASNIYIIDLIANTNEVLASVLGTSLPRFQFSGDGRFLACLTAISNTNQIFLYDLGAGTNALISRAYNGSGAGDGSCDSPTISADGRFIAYRSFADNLVPGDSNGQPDVFLFDRLNGVTTLVSVSHLGNRSGNSLSFSPVFSPDSQTLFFSSWASDLAPGDFNQYADVFALALSADSPVASTNAAPPLDFSGITFGTVNGGGSTAIVPMLTWSASPGAGYQVQFKNSLSDPQWQNLNGSATVVGSQGSVTDPDPEAGQRFYRIVSF